MARKPKRKCDVANSSHELVNKDVQWVAFGIGER